MSEDFDPNQPVEEIIPPPVVTPAVAEQLPVSLEQLHQLEDQFEQEVSPITVEDDQRFDRVRFDLHDGVSIVFRGREELPTFETDDGDSKVTRGVLGINERPRHTSGDKYGDWTMLVTSGEPNDDVFERAAEEGSDRVELIAVASPEGMVEAAITLIDLGRGDPAQKGRLEALRKSLQEGEINDDILKLYDDIFVASTVDVESGNMLGYTTQEGQGAGQLDPRAPMEVALALAGDKTAVDLIKAKEAKLAALEALDEERQRRHEGRTEEDAPLKQPGELLSEEELEVLKTAHLVGVHTTDLYPAEVGDGIRMMRPAAEFDKNNPNSSNRNTLHWSLNHAVKSHIKGNFSAREHTIVAPLEDLARVNGAPGVLYGVDSYFVSNPGEGMFIPPEAVVISTHSDTNKPFINVDGQNIELKNGSFTAEDIDQAIDYLAQHLLKTYKDKGWDESQARYSAARQISGIIADKTHDVFDDLRKMRIPDDQKATLPPPMYEPTLFSLGAFRALRRQGADIDALADRIKAGEDGVYDEVQALLDQAAKEIIEDGTIADYPEMHDTIGEEMRKQVVAVTIRNMGGQVVQSDGTSAYIETDGFQDKEEEVTKRLGFRSGLHQYQPEAASERVIEEQLDQAITKVPVPEDLQSDDGPRAARGDFDWTKFDGRPIWGSMVGSRVPWAIRRQLVSKGLLSYTAQKRDPNLRSAFA